VARDPPASMSPSIYASSPVLSKESKTDPCIHDGLVLRLVHPPSLDMLTAIVVKL
jgi:hypothetical protein